MELAAYTGEKEAQVKTTELIIMSKTEVNKGGEEQEQEQEADCQNKG